MTAQAAEASRAEGSGTDTSRTDTRVRLLARALWGGEWATLRQSPVAGDATRTAAQRAVLVRGEADHWALHLPTRTPPDLALAVAAHAAAHRQFGAPAQARAGLKPVQQALLGVLEDARIEWFAMQAMPGLRAVWWPHHAAAVAHAGNGFEDLLTRLAASLFNPHHADPHAWIARVRRSVFDADGHTLSLRSAQQVRALASVLGNDIGQMRLPFNPRSYAVAARYRDDNTHLWLPDDQPTDDQPLHADAPPDAQTPPAAGHQDDPVPPAAVYPEWDQRIARYRTRWCQVYEHTPTLQARASAAPTPGRDRLVRALARAGRVPRPGATRERDGDELHAVALVEAAIERRRHQPPDARLYRARWRPAPPMAVLLLLDASVSTADRLPGGEPALAALQRGALTTAAALRALGHRCAVWAFASQGRQRIDLHAVLPWQAALGDAQAAQPGGSTRMGAALRHALHLSGRDRRQHPGHRRCVVLLTDGELHDIDVHEKGYLRADLQRAAHEAAQQGIAVRALVHAPGDARALMVALGRAGVRPCAQPAQWPQALVPLLV
ncbi:MAG: VWA domain-containing protein [Hydrogenophaga sp.]|uniref:VWA domain-containing protein n=1 Tax=Hydrogenophaga sp. TaxID=1904254 RepID=UPI001DBA0162|nr:VWA domain-containing protein [Hydrogenophaga sp.]MBX3608999.1 VWA domain-containing protein [Hydrogenophaga sp.]